MKAARGARRTQAQRTAETRAAIVAAVVDSIGAVGFQRTTASEIARRAGVTWGAVQHHFGGKDGILAAVLQDSVARFAERIEAEPLASLPLPERVGRFTRAAWEHFSSPHFRSTLEILLHHNGAGGAAADGSQRDLLRAFDRVWTPVFSDAPLAGRERRTLQNYTVAVLSGLAIHYAFEGGRRTPAGELALLEETLLRAMQGD